MSTSHPRSAPHDSPSIEAIGVYEWPFTDDDVLELCDTSWGSRDDDVVQLARQQLSALVLVELLVRSRGERLDVGGFSQVDPHTRDKTEQVPYDESYWSADGETYLRHDNQPELSEYRIVFFLHEFDPSRPLFTAQKLVIPLPQRSKLPSRIRKVIHTYSPP